MMRTPCTARRSRSSSRARASRASRAVLRTSRTSHSCCSAPASTRCKPGRSSSLTPSVSDSTPTMAKPCSSAYARSCRSWFASPRSACSRRLRQYRMARAGRGSMVISFLFRSAHGSRSPRVPPCPDPANGSTGMRVFNGMPSQEGHHAGASLRRINTVASCRACGVGRDGRTLSPARPPRTDRLACPQLSAASGMAPRRRGDRQLVAGHRGGPHTRIEPRSPATCQSVVTAQWRCVGSRLKPTRLPTANRCCSAVRAIGGGTSRRRHDRSFPRPAGSSRDRPRQSALDAWAVAPLARHWPPPSRRAGMVSASTTAKATAVATALSKKGMGSRDSSGPGRKHRPARRRRRSAHLPPRPARSAVGRAAARLLPGGGGYAGRIHPRR